MPLTYIVTTLLTAILLSTTVLAAQTSADREVIERARSLYYSPVSRPAYIACDATIDWDSVAAQANLPQEEGYLLGLKLAKAMTVTFVTRGRKQIKVDVTGDPRIAEQKQRVQLLINAFFRLYWSTADGRMLPGANAEYELTSNSDGYVITGHGTGIVGTIQMDSSFLITKARIYDPESTEDAEISLTFKKQNDALLHLSGLSINAKLGQLRRTVEYSFDYQQVGGFYVPQHVTMSMPGVVSYPNTFSNCQVLDKNNAPHTLPR